MTKRDGARDTTPVARILVIEPDDRYAEQVQSTLDGSELDFDVVRCRTVASARTVVDSSRDGFDVLLAAAEPAANGGTGLSANVRDSGKIPICYLMFDAGREELAAEALATGEDCIIIRDDGGGWLTMLPPLLMCAIRRIRNLSMNTPERLSVIVESDPQSTEYREIQKSLADTMPYLRALVASPFEYFLMVDKNAKILYVNRMTEGVRFEDVVGRATMYDFIAEDMHEMVRSKFDAVFSAGKSVYFETYAPGLDRWYTNTAGPVYRDGEVIGASVFSHEVTEQKKAERKLRESEQRFRQLAENIQDVFYILDATDFKTIYVSPAYEKVYGQPIEKIYKNAGAWIDAVHPDDREEVRRRHSEMLADLPRKFSGREHRIVMPNGDIRWVLNRAFVIDGGDNGRDLVCGIVTDVTARMEAERDLVETSSRLEALFRTFPDLLFIVANDGTILDFRVGTTEDLYVQPDQLLGRRVQDLMPPEVGSIMADALATLHGTHRPQAAEYWLDVPSGHKAFEARFVAMDENRAAIIARDITAQKRAQEEVRKAQAELEMRVLERTKELHAANEELRQEMLARKKTEEAFRQAEKLASIGTLAAGIAHEINNPLGSILMAADNAMYAVEHPEALAEAGDALRDIKDEAKRAGRIVKTVLQFARRDESQMQPYPVGDVVRAACRVCADPAGNRGVTITPLIPENLPEIRINPSEMEQVFVNVISNAVEASRDGQSVTIQLGESNGRIEATVTDNGCGMTQEKARRIFDPFFTTRQTEGGTGLGLSLAHTIVRLHGGTIDVESEPGAGTRLTVSLPVRSDAETGYGDQRNSHDRR